MINELKCDFKANIKNVSLSRGIAQMFFSQIESELNYLNEIKTIVSEGVTNAIIHGYKDDSSKDVILNLSYDDSFIYIEIIDYGVGIKDIELAKTPMFTTKPEDDRSGLGFTLMDVFSDELEVISKENQGTTLKIVKKINE